MLYIHRTRPKENYSHAEIHFALQGGELELKTEEDPGNPGKARFLLPLELTSYKVVGYSVAPNLLKGYPVVVSVNESPTADAGEDETVAAGANVTLDGSGSSDPDNDMLTYLWEQISGTPVSINNATSERASFSAPSTSSSHVLEFQLAVSDGETGSTDSVTIEVRAILLPQLLAPAGGRVAGDRYSWNVAPNARRYRFTYNLTNLDVRDTFVAGTSINHPHSDPGSIYGLERVRAEAPGYRPSPWLFF